MIANFSVVDRTVAILGWSFNESTVKIQEKCFSLIFKLKYNIEIKNANEHYRHNKKVETTPQSHMTIPRYSAVR